VIWKLDPLERGPAFGLVLGARVLLASLVLHFGRLCPHRPVAGRGCGLSMAPWSQCPVGTVPRPDFLHKGSWLQSVYFQTVSPVSRDRHRTETADGRACAALPFARGRAVPTSGSPERARNRGLLPALRGTFDPERAAVPRLRWSGGFGPVPELLPRQPPRIGTL
jgi:hypothetical protein